MAKAYELAAEGKLNAERAYTKLAKQVEALGMKLDHASFIAGYEWCMADLEALEEQNRHVHRPTVR